jgi:hypothetical protein
MMRNRIPAHYTTQIDCQENFDDVFLTPMPGAGTTNDENLQAGVVESHKKEYRKATILLA